MRTPASAMSPIVSGAALVRLLDCPQPNTAPGPCSLEKVRSAGLLRTSRKAGHTVFVSPALPLYPEGAIAVDIAIDCSAATIMRRRLVLSIATTGFCDLVFLIHRSLFSEATMQNET